MEPSPVQPAGPPLRTASASAPPTPHSQGQPPIAGAFMAERRTETQSALHQPQAPHPINQPTPPLSTNSPTWAGGPRTS